MGMPRRLLGCALLAGLLGVACGQTSPAQTASQTPSANPSPTLPPSTGPTSEPNAFGANDCLNPPSGTATPPLADHFHVVVQIPAGWKQEPAGFSETQMLVLDSPSDYSNTPTRIGLLALMAVPSSDTPDKVAAQWYGPGAPGSNPDFEAHLVGNVTDCTVAGDPAAFFQYKAKRSQLVDSKSGDWTGYMVVFVHHHVPDNLPYALRIEGTGGIDPRAIHDAKSILGSWTWTVSSS